MEDENIKLSKQGIEIWRDIPNTSGNYQASTLGRVRSVDRWVNGAYGKRKIKGKILKQQARIQQKKYPNMKYLYVSIWKNNKHKYCTVHRLIAKTFLVNSFGKDAQVNHIDANPLNNALYNLEYCTAKYNVNHAKKLGHFNLINAKETIVINTKTKSTKEFKSAKECRDYLYNNNVGGCKDKYTYNSLLSTIRAYAKTNKKLVGIYEIKYKD